MNVIARIALIALALLPIARASNAQGAGSRELTYLVTNLAEAPGTPEAMPHAMDTRIHVVYGGGLPAAATPGGAPAPVVIAGGLYLYGDDSKLMVSATGQEICNPCSFGLSSSDRKATLRLDDLIMASGGFPATVRPGFAVVTLAGADTARVGLLAQYVLSGETPGAQSTCGGGHVTLMK